MRRTGHSIGMELGPLFNNSIFRPSSINAFEIVYGLPPHEISAKCACVRVCVCVFVCVYVRVYILVHRFVGELIFNFQVAQARTMRAYTAIRLGRFVQTLDACACINRHSSAHVY